MGHHAPAPHRGGVRGAGRALFRRRALPQPRRHGPLPLRRGRVQVLRRPAAAAGGRAAGARVSAARVDRGGVAGRPRPRHSLSAHARRLSRPVRPARPAQADPAPVALRGRRLQLLAPGHLRRDRVSAPDDLSPEPPRRRLRRRRIPPGRAAPPRPVPRRGGPARPGPDRHLHDPRAPGPRLPRHVPRRVAARREPRDVRPPVHPRRDLPRRQEATTGGGPAGGGEGLQTTTVYARPSGFRSSQSGSGEPGGTPEGTGLEALPAPRRPRSRRPAQMCGRMSRANAS
jgi:hypothetical protein